MGTEGQQAVGWRGGGWSSVVLKERSYSTSRLCPKNDVVIFLFHTDLKGGTLDLAASISVAHRIASVAHVP